MHKLCSLATSSNTLLPHFLEKNSFVLYDERVKHLPKILLLFLLFFFFRTANVYADAQLQVDPNTIKLGETAQVTITNLSGFNDHAPSLLEVIHDGDTLGGVNITIDPNSFNPCKIEQSGSTYWTIGTVPTCSDNSDGTFDISGIIDTNKVGLDPATTSNITLHIQLSHGTANTVAEGTLTIIPTQESSAPFEIQSISPIPADPNSIITIILNNVSNATYEVGLQGYTIASTKSRKQCTPPTCQFAIQLPNSITTTTLTVYATDESISNPNNQTKTKSLQVNPSISITDSVRAVSTTIPTPSLTPPVPPCNKFVIINSNGTEKDADANQTKAIKNGTFETTYNNGKPDNQKLKFKCTELLTAFQLFQFGSVDDLIALIFRILLSLSGGIALALIIYSGYRLMVSSGSPDEVKKARELFVGAITGFIFTIFSLVILQIIGVDLLKLPDFKSMTNTTNSQRSRGTCTYTDANENSTPIEQGNSICDGNKKITCAQADSAPTSLDCKSIDPSYLCSSQSGTDATCVAPANTANPNPQTGCADEFQACGIGDEVGCCTNSNFSCKNSGGSQRTCQPNGPICNITNPNTCQSGLTCIADHAGTNIGTCQNITP